MSRLFTAYRAYNGIMAAPLALVKPPVSFWSVIEWRLGQLVCCFLPLSTLGFLLTGPHTAVEALLWTSPIMICVALDLWGPRCRSDMPPLQQSTVYSQCILPLLAALQFVNITCMLIYVSTLNWNDVSSVLNSLANLLVLRILVGTNSCSSGIAVAHELIHRKHWAARALGRMLLWTVCYDHFAVEHVRGHHRLVATHNDPATAHYGESYEAFWRRSLKGQFLQAWSRETARIRPAGHRWRWLQHQILTGLFIEIALLLGIASVFGLLALACFLYQALVAVRLLETVNYFQHWGLTRNPDQRPDAVHAWATDSWFTLHTFLGLSRHADHHARADTAFQHLKYQVLSPQLPYGYFIMAFLVKLDNPRYQRMAKTELKKKGALRLPVTPEREIRR